MRSVSLGSIGPQMSNAGIQTSIKPFEHVHAPKAALYRRIMRTFGDAKQRFLVHLRPEDASAILDAAANEGIEGRSPPSWTGPPGPPPHLLGRTVPLGPVRRGRVCSSFLQQSKVSYDIPHHVGDQPMLPFRSRAGAAN
jgi:hypothetical protein